jgi:hypothetical protein
MQKTVVVNGEWAGRQRARRQWVGGLNSTSWDGRDRSVWRLEIDTWKRTA